MSTAPTCPLCGNPARSVSAYSERGEQVTVWEHDQGKCREVWRKVKKAELKVLEDAPNRQRVTDKLAAAGFDVQVTANKGKNR